MSELLQVAAFVLLLLCGLYDFFPWSVEESCELQNYCSGIGQSK